MQGENVKVEFVGLDHVVLRVRNLDDMLGFYRGVLGCAIERELPEFGLVQLRAGSALIDLVPVDSKLGAMGGAAPGAEGHNMDHFCLRVAATDLAAIASQLAQQGIGVGQITRRYGADGYGPSIYIKDPEGNTVELKGAPETP